MDEQVTRPVHDGAEERLRIALNVDPSPEFLARVRTRIASEPPPSRWRLASWSRWMLAPAAAAIALALVAAMWPDTELVPPSRPDIALAPRVAFPSPADVAPQPSGGDSRAPVAVRARSAAPPGPGIETRVLISEDEKRAFEALLAAVQLNTMPVRVVAEGETMAEPLTPAPLEMEQFTIQPLQMTRLE